MNKLYFILLLGLNLSLTACINNKLSSNGNKPIDLSQALETNKISKDIENIINNRCIQDQFAQGQSDNLYGIECIKGKHLSIQTDKEGEAVTTSHSTNKEGLRLEEDLSFINKVYNPKYKILNKKGDDKTIPFLKDFLPLNERFLGSLDAKYDIIFETRGDYLILFKASKDLKKIPYIERTSMIEKDGYKMVPFIGYPIQYCSAEFLTNSQREKTYENRANCNSDPATAKYIRILKTNKQVYQYIEKKDLFPSDYFKGRWFFSEGPIETSSSREEGHIPPFFVNLIRFDKTSKTLQIVDISGNVEDRNKKIVNKLPVDWIDYEMNQDGDVFKSFGEREYTKNDATARDHLQINFLNFINQGHEVIDFLVTEDYFSFVLKKTSASKSLKYKYSFLRETAVNSKDFVSRKWFIDDHEDHFGILPTGAQAEKKEGESTETEFLDHLRMIRFNINNQKSIKWYFSKNSTHDPFYRDIAREAIQVWNQAFQMITQNTDKKIKIELIETEEKDLGDIRYNIINLIKPADVSSGNNLLGVAPSYVNPDTGQIIGTTANILLHNTLEVSHKLLRNYIRYEIFQKNKKSKEENEIHVISPFLQAKVKKQCPEVAQFINKKRKEKIKPETELNDKALFLTCSRKVSRNGILQLVLHETGHSFGLGHNFKASTDKSNYYQSKSEIKQYFPSAKLDLDVISKSSSVMDYLPLFSYPSLTFLGKYDLAALRFLYMNQLKTKEGELINLDIPKDLSKQKPLSSDHVSQMKPYLHCSDAAASQQEDFLCIRFDYGSTPLDISNFYINGFKRYFNSSRYRYDSVTTGSYPLNQSYFNSIISFYIKWIQLRNQYLASQNAFKITRPVISEDKNFIEAYQKTIGNGLGINEEYNLYHSIRSNIFKFLKDTVLLKSMKCKVADHNNQVRWINLEDIKSALLPTHKDNLYVEDCSSKMIQDFLKTEGLSFQGQKGLEDFSTNSYYSEGKNAFNQWNVISLSQTLNPPLEDPQFNSLFLIFSYEPDFYDSFRLTLKNQLLEIEKGQTILDLHRLFNLYRAHIQFMLSRLNKNEDATLLKENISQIKFITFNVGTDVDSFYNKVEKPINDGLKIEEIEIPFLTKSYKKYIEKYPEQSERVSFQEYLLNDNNMVAKVLNKKDENNTFTIPYINENSFSTQVILKYNENLKELEKLKMLELTNNKLTFLEELKQKEIENHNEMLYSITGLIR